MPWKEVNVMNQRVEFVLKSLRTENFRELCQEYGISAKTGYKWQKRFVAEGLCGMREVSRRPRQCPHGLREDQVCEIVRLKERHRHWGPKKIRAVYHRLHGGAPSESSFKRVLERAGLTEKRRTRKRELSGRLHSGRQASRPNEVWTVDFKGWWYEPGGGRCEPLTVRDEFSRYVLEVRALANAKTETVRACLERLFERYGLPEAIRSDNGAPFASTASVLGLSRLSAWWLALGIDLERSRPGCPQDNGGHERLHLDISREIEGQNLAENQAAFDEWRKTFNQERPHEALGMKCPAEVYKPSERSYRGTPADLDYKAMAKRKVSVIGRIVLGSNSYFISEALRGWSIGLESKGAGKWHVWFGRLLIGEIDETTSSFQPAQEQVINTQPKEKVA